MARRVDAYVDTAALIAFADRSDSYHPLFARLFSDPPRLVTTPLVVTEGHGWFLRRYDRTRALQFLSMLEDMPFLDIVPLGADDIRAGTAILRRLQDQNLTMVDAVGLHLMRAQRIRSCWSTDHHMRLTGVKLAIDV